MELKDKIFELAIVGGGPGGTASAVAARSKGLRVVIWERQRFPHDKVCGEFLSGESVPLIERLVPDALARAAWIGRCELVSRHGRRVSFTLPEPARGLSRKSLDYALWKAATKAGADTREGIQIGRISRQPLSPPQNSLWQITTSTGEVTWARSLALACGRHQPLELLGLPSTRPQPSADAWMGIKAHFRGVVRRDAVEMYFFPGGYCGLAPIEDGLYNVCCLIRNRALREAGPTRGAKNLASWLHCVARHSALDARLKDATQVTASVATAPVQPRPYQVSVEDALVVGDAGGFLDPFTGDGISVALQSAMLGAEILAESWAQGAPLRADNIPYREYHRRLRQSLSRSYRWAHRLRTLVAAPDYCQAAAVPLLACFGRNLVAFTRWRSASDLAAIVSTVDVLKRPSSPV